MIITLVCAMGMSTSILEKKIKEEGAKKGMEIDIAALTAEAHDPRMDKTDILLLGPQVRYLKSRFEKLYKDKIPVIEVMSMSDYGLLNAEKILSDAMALYNAQKS